MRANGSVWRHPGLKWECTRFCPLGELLSFRCDLGSQEGRYCRRNGRRAWAGLVIAMIADEMKDETMKDFVVYCRWPDGDTEWLFADTEKEARSWAADARIESECMAGVYGLLVMESLAVSVLSDTRGDSSSLGRYAGQCARAAVPVQQ